jgi:hypothetical protein
MSETIISPFVPEVPAHDEVPLVDAIPEAKYVNNVSDHFTLESDQTMMDCNGTHFDDVKDNVINTWQNNHTVEGVHDADFEIFDIEDFQMEYDSTNHTLRIFNNRTSGNTSFFNFPAVASTDQYFSTDFESLVHIPGADPNAQTDRRKLGFFRSFVLMVEEIDMDPLQNDAQWEWFQSEWRHVLQHVEIKFRNYTQVVDLGEEEEVDFEITPDHRKPYEFIFHQVPPHDRKNLMVRASFTGMTNNQYLGFSNESYTPIKYYQLDNTDQIFWVDLYDAVTYKPVELGPNDHFIIEAVALTAPKTPLN